MTMNATPRERFDRAIEPDLNSGCWLWSGVILGNGYGQVRIDNKKWLAHRLSWSLHSGNVPRGLLVLHRCDVRACVNPHHLFLGTHRDNINDCVAKGRYPNKGGETAPNSKLTQAAVDGIWEAIECGETQAAIAARFGTTRQNVSAIKRGKSWNANNRAAERVR